MLHKKNYPQKNYPQNNYPQENYPQPAKKLPATRIFYQTVTIRLKCGSGSTERMRNGYGGKMRNGYGDKMRHNEFFAPFLRFCVFDLCYFVMDATY